MIVKVVRVWRELKSEGSEELGFGKWVVFTPPQTKTVTFLKRLFGCLSELRETLFLGLFG